MYIYVRKYLHSPLDWATLTRHRKDLLNPFIMFGCETKFAKNNVKRSIKSHELIYLFKEYFNIRYLKIISPKILLNNIAYTYIYVC